MQAYLTTNEHVVAENLQHLMSAVAAEDLITFWNKNLSATQKFRFKFKQRCVRQRN